MPRSERSAADRAGCVPEKNPLGLSSDKAARFIADTNQGIGPRSTAARPIACFQETVAGPDGAKQESTGRKSRDRAISRRPESNAQKIWVALVCPLDQIKI